MLKRKQKLYLIIGSSGIVASGVTTTLISQTQSQSEPFKFKIDTDAKPNFQAEQVDQSKSQISASDYNLPKVQNPPVVEPPIVKDPETTVFNPIIQNPDKEKKEEDKELPPATSDPIKDQETKITNEPAPTPVPNPEPEKKTIKIKIENIEFEADVATIPKRQYEQSDVEKGITNRIPYYAEITHDVLNVKNALTEENIGKTITAAQNKATKIAAGISPFVASLSDDRDIEAKQAQIKNDGTVSEHFGNLWFRYHRLLTSKENVKKYLLDSVTDEQLDKWWNMKETLTWPRSIGTETRELGKMLILMHIDPKKITKISQTEKDSLEKGFIIPEYGGDISVNEAGEWTSSTHEPVVNTVTAEYKRNNQVYRVMGNNDSYWRNSEDILKGKYANWNDRDVTAQYRSEGLDIPNSGIKITEYTRLAKVENALVDREKTVVVTIDVVQPGAYQKAEKLIKDLQAKGKDITGYRLMNIGKSGADQNMDKIFAALPNKLPLLELFFESKNTTALKYLKNKEIDELSLLSNNRLNVNSDDWSINPWALNKVAWVNMADYNTTFSTDPNQPPFYARITFDNLAFDAEDYTIPGDFTIINNGLRMAYWTRNNERIFQGAWGPGLKPDRSSDGNSYPMGVDFSRIPTIKTLRGLEFNDVSGKQSSKRMLNKIKLFNDSNIWTVTTTDMNEAQFDDIIVKNNQYPKSKITFSNGRSTQSIRINATQSVQNLNSSGLRHLAALIEYSDGTFNRNTQILVTDGAVALYNTLKNAGYNVRYASTEDEYEIV
ncbi:membrane protein [Mycoplasmopsis bovirhinis]|uniref:putative immunoglobulin-blocking virulence protein n=1 Tax=Mycoplasmopsis bovirhinis TaxID=29553 RepID=UPI000BB9C6EF|nr:putative immunoglobulin-blocking virulence protein [Mycoplasmopsis bovirhinis]BBA22186.1 membrane protein [Mycoplasmopsis bovirhinis]